MGTTIGGATCTISMDKTIIVVAQQKHHLLQSETIDSVESSRSRPSDVILPQREKQENVEEEEETKLTNETERCDKSTLMTGPSQLVAEAVEATIGDEPVPEVRIRMRHEKIGESLAAVSKKGTLSM